jgi:formylmethanofuran dehydrogenase subunit E
MHFLSVKLKRKGSLINQVETQITLMENLLAKSANSHHRLCPRQVLGVRMGLMAGQLLDLQVPRSDKLIHAFMETDGCAVDGVAVATGCSVGRRTMHILDFGKIAATFVDRETLKAFRICPNPEARRLAKHYAPDASDDWHAYLLGYQVMPEQDLLIVQPVRLTISLEAIISHEAIRALCDRCGEEIYNEREVRSSGLTLCRACAGEVYYTIVELLG